MGRKGLIRMAEQWGLASRTGNGLGAVLAVLGTLILSVQALPGGQGGKQGTTWQAVLVEPGGRAACEYTDTAPPDHLVQTLCSGTATQTGNKGHFIATFNKPSLCLDPFTIAPGVEVERAAILIEVNKKNQVTGGHLFLTDNLDQQYESTTIPAQQPGPIVDPKGFTVVFCASDVEMIPSAGRVKETAFEVRLGHLVLCENAGSCP